MSTATTMGIHSSGSNPATLPLITTSIGLFYAVIQPTLFLPFLRSSTTRPKETNAALQLWWHHFFWLGLFTILPIGAANLAGGIYALRSFERGTQEWRVAAAGLGFAMAHFLWGPKVGGVISQLCDGEIARRGETVERQRLWLRMHAWRTCLVDVPAVACFAWLVFGNTS